MDGGGHPYPASRYATTPFFGFLSSHDIAQGIQREKAGGGGHAGIPQGKATAVIPGNAARGSLLTWTAVELC